MSSSPFLSAMLYQAGTIEEMRNLSDTCVENGISNIYFPDHLIGGGNAEATSSHPWLAMVPVLMDIAQRHPNIVVGTLVASPSLRPAAQLCVEASTIAHIIGPERFILSVGAGGADSDQVHLDEHADTNELSERFETYVKKLNDYRKNTSQPSLRLASPFTLRVASDSVSTIDVVSRYGDAWVTTGGWKKNLEERIERIDTLYKKLDNFSGNIAVCADSSDGLTITSSQEDVERYASLYDVPINEIILPVSPKR